MKKTIATFILLSFFGAVSFAGDASENLPWDFFGLVLFPGTPSSSNYSNVSGLRFGLPVSGGDTKVYGIETAIFCCCTKEVRGIQTAPLFCVSTRITGIQASPVNIADDVVGMQFGLVNISKNATFQLGLVNYMKNGILPFLP
ncbi:MAG: hypothetical protein GXP32_04785, partial [Kiritimatiellaeota bacterium]|nr:hypothetical protein [Kiritimatiellota bacterium]